MATSSERSPPPFPDSEDQDALLESEETRRQDRDSDDGDEDADELFMSTISDPPDTDTTPPATSQNTDPSLESPIDLNDPLADTASDPSDSKAAGDALSEPSDDFEDLSNTESDSPDDAKNDAAEDFFDLSGGEGETKRDAAPLVDVQIEAAPFVDVQVEAAEETIDVAGLAEKRAIEVEKEALPALVDVTNFLSTETQPEKLATPSLDLHAAAPRTAETKKPKVVDLFADGDDEGSDLFAAPKLSKPSKQQPHKSLFEEVDDDLFPEPLGAAAKKPAPAASVLEPKPIVTKAEVEVRSKGAVLMEPEDLFTHEAAAPKMPSGASKTNGINDEETDIFAEATVELSLDSPRNERKRDASKPSAQPAQSASSSLAKPAPAALEELEEEEEEEDDKFDIQVSVKEPEKIGDRMNAYMAYKVFTQTSLAMFRSPTLSVRRRYSDFLGLYEKLSEKHGPNGYIVPPPPEKNLLGMTKVKVGKEDSSSADFLERRRGALERYVQRVVRHPTLLQDPDVREFLEREELPRAVNTQALSGAGFLKMLNRATDAVSKMTIKMNESDVWFEDKLQEVESADQQFRKLHALVESLVLHRKELSLNTASFAKSAAMLGSAEDNTALSRALSQLSEVEDKMEQLHQDQAANDAFGLAEHIADFIRLLGAVRGSFDHRMKAWQRWQDAQSMLQKKREAEAKLLWANKPDKLQLAKEEIAEWEAKVTQYERDFERVSATVRKEVLHFEKERTKNFKRQIINYLESMLRSQQQLIKYWDAFLPEAKAIA
ncbi:sorting nexin-1-like [Eucyclogobius newberryi]|uniref:sorting nexin-1-like n=1 Tax=Eucyclogobius newberryi TaxID=166745 RepID=UPI003B592CD2